MPDAYEAQKLEPTLILKADVNGQSREKIAIIKVWNSIQLNKKVIQVKNVSQIRHYFQPHCNDQWVQSL